MGQAGFLEHDDTVRGIETFASEVKPSWRRMPSAGALVSSEDLRRTCAAWPTGIAVVTSTDADGRPVGLAVNSFTSVSLDPPLVLFCAALTSTTWPHIRDTGRFAVNVLAAGQHDAAKAFARSGGDKFADLGWAHRDGLPELTGIAAVLRCSLGRP